LRPSVLLSRGALFKRVAENILDKSFDKAKHNGDVEALPDGLAATHKVNQ
jgi:hypothetical protein